MKGAEVALGAVVIVGGIVLGAYWLQKYRDEQIKTRMRGVIDRGLADRAAGRQTADRAYVDTALSIIPTSGFLMTGGGNRG